MTEPDGVDRLARMTTRTPIPAFASLGAALAFLVLTAIHLTHGTFDAELTSTVDYLNDGAFTAALLLSIPGLLMLERWNAPRRPVVVAAVGQALVAVGVLAGLMAGESPDWFAAVGVPGNLAAFAGTLLLSHWAWRSRALPRWAAVALALSVPAGVGLGEFGGSIVPAALWAYVGLRAASMRL